MAKKPVNAPKTEPKGFVENPTHAKKGEVKHNPPIEGDKALIEKTKAKTDAEKAEKAKIKADAKALKDADAAVKKEAKAKVKAEREARLAELGEGKQYHGTMLALADRVKSGAYVKSATGQLRSDDGLAQALDGVYPTDVVRIGLDVLGLADNPYTKLNIGQQSMNLRNRMRGAIRKETLSIAAITEYIERNGIQVTTAADNEAKAKAKAERVAAAKAKAEEKSVKAAKPAEQADPAAT